MISKIILTKELVESFIFDMSIESPFSEKELCDDYFHKAASSILELLDMYRPLVIRRCEPVNCEPSWKLIRTYSSNHNFNSQVSEIDELLMEGLNHQGWIYLYSKPWTIPDLLSDANKLDYKYFKDGIKILVGMYASNKRRSVGIQSPIDLKGDSLYDEYKEKYDSYKQMLINASYNTH